MSVVTNIILSFCASESEGFDDQDVVDRVNAFFIPPSKGFVNPQEHDWYGGNKFLERPTFVAAFNYLDIQGLIDHIKTLPWKYPDIVQIMICDQEAEEYTTFWPCKKLERRGSYNVSFTKTLR